MNIYRYTDYREIVAKVVNSRKKEGKAVSFSSLADYLKVQKTYVSRVIKGDAHFNTDQLYATCEFLELLPEHTDYLLLLLEHERSYYPRRKKELLGRIHQVQEEKKDVKKHLKANFVELPDTLSEYFLDPMLSLMHMYLSIPTYASRPSQVGRALGMEPALLEQRLMTLERLAVIERSGPGKAIKVLREHLFLPKESPLNLPCELLQRQMVMDHLRKLSADQRVVISLDFTADEKTRKLIHNELLAFLRRAEALIKAAPSEQVYRMGFELFPWHLQTDPLA